MGTGPLPWQQQPQHVPSHAPRADSVPWVHRGSRAVVCGGTGRAEVSPNFWGLGKASSCSSSVLTSISPQGMRRATDTFRGAKDRKKRESFSSFPPVFSQEMEHVLQGTW